MRADHEGYEHLREEKLCEETASDLLSTGPQINRYQRERHKENQEPALFRFALARHV